MRIKLLYHNLSIPGETLCFGRKLVPHKEGLALVLRDEEDLRKEQAAEKMVRAGIAATLAKDLGWEEARRLCVMGKGGHSLEGLSLPEQIRGNNALAAVWFYLSMREEPESGEELMELHNGLSTLMSTDEETNKLTAALGEQGAQIFHQAIRAIRARQEDMENPCDVNKLCDAVDYPAVRQVFLQNWKA